MLSAKPTALDRQVSQAGDRHGRGGRDRGRCGAGRRDHARTSPKRWDLKAGDAVKAIIKSTEVMIDKS